MLQSWLITNWKWLAVATVAGAGAFWLYNRRSKQLSDLPPKPWHSDAWKELKQHRRDQAVNEWYEQSGKAIMDDVSDLVNAYNSEQEAGKALGRGLAHQHRTLQSNFFRALPHMLTEYAKTGTDARNESAVKLAHKLASSLEGEFLPFI